MKNPRSQRRSGQAIVMVTLGLFAMVGLIGLAVDLSWAYFLEKTMQAAADAAALSAVTAAKEAAGSIGAVNCSNAGCTNNPTPCSSIGTSDTLKVACVYASQNGFTSGASGQQVTVNASIPLRAQTVDDTCSGTGATVSHPPTAGCVDTIYWVTVRISQQVPQLFSAILGNYSGTVSARATAAIVDSELEASLILLNRAQDMPSPPNDAPPQGTNLELAGSGEVYVPGGIHLASSGAQAGRIQGSGYVRSPFTRVRDPGGIGGSAYDHWICTAGGSYCPPIQEASDGPAFFDPMSTKGGQPPLGSYLTNSSTPIYEVLNGTLNDTICPSWVCAPGIYISTRRDCQNCSATHPSGDPINFPNNTTVTFQGGTFGEYMFVGGFDSPNGATINMGPGRYVFAGTSDPSSNLVDIPNGVTLNGGGSDAGRIMIFTDFRTGAMRNTGAMGGSQTVQSYAGEMETVFTRVATHFTRGSDAGGDSWNNQTPWRSTGLPHAAVEIQAGNNASSRITLKGLAKGDSNENFVPAELRPFAPFVMWQDQHNSNIHYTQGSNVDIGCASPNNTLDRPCTQTPDHANAPKLEIHSTPFLDLTGAIYQPRGAWTYLIASGTETGPLQIISGGMKIQGTPQLTLTGLPQPVTILSIALVE